MPGIKNNIRDLGKSFESLKKIDFIQPDKAFEEGIKDGRLSADPSHDNFAGHYMYMGTESGKHLFKNINTRKYLP